MSVIYILRNPQNPDVSKIGESEIGGHSRTAYQGVTWELYKEFPVSDQRRKGIERYIFRELKGKNLNVGLEGPREIFTIRPAEAAKRVEDIIRHVVSQVKDGVKDADYWNYMATKEELAERRARLAVQEREEAELRRQKLEKDAHERKLREQEADRKQRLQFLLDNYNEARRAKDVFNLIFCAVLSAILLMPVGLSIEILIWLLDLDFPRGDAFKNLTIAISIGLSIFLIWRWGRQDLKESAEQLDAFQKEHGVKCCKCERWLWKSLTRDPDDSRPLLCSNCAKEPS